MLRFLSSAAITLLVATLTACGSGEQESSQETSALLGRAQGFNLIIVSVDTLRADRLGSFGYRVRPTSPAIDELVLSGTRFERAMTQRSLTWPSLASMLSGLYPSGHGIVDNGYDFLEATPTLPKLLEAAGYDTAAFLSNMCSAGHSGWDELVCARSRDSRLLPSASAWLEQRVGDNPFFLWLHYFGAHGPYSNGLEIAAKELNPGYHGPVGPKKWMLNRIMTESIELDDDDLFQLDALYDAAVIGTDRYVGQLLSYLEAAGYLERTLVVFLADHGEELYDHHGYFYHACSLYQPGLHVPLAFVAPGVLPAAMAIPDAVEMVDVAPTVLDLLGIEKPSKLHGRSLIGHLDPARPAPVARPAFSEFPQQNMRTVLDGSWKLVHNPDEAVVQCFTDAPLDLFPIKRTELYDLSQDPGETTDVSAEYPDKVEQLLALLDARFALIGDGADEQELPEELKAQLRALGYLAN